MRYSRYSSGPFLLALTILDHASSVELNFVVLLNFDNILEAPRSTRRNHHCEKGFSQKLDFFGGKKCLTELKTYHLCYSFLKHDAIEIADPGSMQDACYINFVIDLAHRRVSLAQW